MRVTDVPCSHLLQRGIAHSQLPCFALSSTLVFDQPRAESLTEGQLLCEMARDHDLCGLIKNINLINNILLGI